MEIVSNPKRKASYLEKLSRKPSMRVYLGFDTETSLKTDDSGEVVHHFELCCSELFTLDSMGRYHSIEKCEFWDIESFHKYIVKLFDNHKTIYFVAHNMTFDSIVARLYQLVDDMGLICAVFNPRRASFFCRWKSDDKNFVLIDSLNFLTGSLKAIGESVGLEKLEMPKGTPKGDKWLVYCRRDVDVMVKGMRVLSKFLSRWQLGQLDITRASIAFKIFRRYYMTTNMLKSIDLELLRLEYRSYHGGRVECFHIGDLPRQDYYLVDFNSLYPSVMLDNLFSIKKRVFKDKGNFEHFKKLSRNYGLCANVKIETDYPCLPFRKDKKIIFPVGEFWSYLSTPEILFGLERGIITDVAEYAGYYQRPIFGEYVKDLHKIKTKYKKDNNLVFAFMAKILLNSLYGKFAQKIAQLEPAGMTAPHAYGVYDELDLKTREVINFKIIQHQVYVETRNMVGYNSMPLIASEVSSYGRVKLWKSIELAGRDNVYYCDTDSLLVNKTGLDNLKPLIKGGKMGYLELEKTGRKVKLFGAKDYDFEGEVKIKGIPRKAEQISDNEYQYEYWFSTVESLRDTSDSVMKTKPMLKHMTRKYDKGVVQDDGSVKPHRITSAFMNE